MTLREVIRRMEIIASKQPAVNMVVENDVFRLNATSDSRYGVFAWTQGEHSTSLDSSLINYNFTLFYVDRLTSDKSNQLEIQSTGIMVLDNIIRSLEDAGIPASSEYRFQTFNQRFLDDCAGVFCSVSFQVANSIVCPDTFADFNDDFNDDFFVY